MTDVAAWLRGLGQYEAAFRDNGVDASVLPDLTAEDPKEMGVAAVGHRRKLLAAITALRGPAPSSYIPTDEQLPPARRRCRPVNTRLRQFCLPQHQDSALYPVISQLEGAAWCFGRRCRSCRAMAGPNFSTQRRTVS